MKKLHNPLLKGTELPVVKEIAPYEDKDTKAIRELLENMYGTKVVKSNPKKKSKKRKLVTNNEYNI